MADREIGTLESAKQVQPEDLLVVLQNGVAKNVSGQVLLAWLTAAADGHGGIQSIQEVGTEGLVTTYRITLADASTFDFPVTNARSIVDIRYDHAGTTGSNSIYRIEFNDGTYDYFSVNDGMSGRNAHVWIRYAAQEPTAENPSIGELPDKWIGIYAGWAATAPENWQSYKWSKLTGDEGPVGGYYFPSLTQLNDETVRFRFTYYGPDQQTSTYKDVTLPQGPPGDPGESGVYTLAEGETLEDVPEWASVVVDPYKDPSSVKMTAVLEDGSVVAYKLFGEVVPA